MMLKEAMEWFKATIDKPQSVVVDDTGEEYLLLNYHTGEAKTVPALKRHRKLHALSVADLVAMTKRFCAMDGGHCIYVTSDKVEAVLNELSQARHDRVLLELNAHPAMSSLVTGMCAKPKQFCEFIRVKLFDCEIIPLDLHERLQQVKFHKSETTSASAKHGDEQLGASITKKLTGTAEIPACCVVKFEPYPDLSEELNGIEVSVQCAIAVDLDQGTLSLKPFPGQIAQAAQEGMMAVAKLTREQAGDIPVFLGFTE